MTENINNDNFISKIIQRKIKRNIVYAEVDMSYMSMKNKIMFMVKELLSINFVKVRIVLLFWDDIEKILNVFKYYKVNNYHIINQYKRWHSNPGVINLSMESLNQKFLKSLIKRQYGTDFSHKDSIDLKCVYIFEMNDGSKMIIYNYDDRGYRKYILLPSQCRRSTL